MGYHHLTMEQRCQIYALKSILTQKEIAAKLAVSPATISRELRRNSGLNGYRYKQANEKSTTRRANASSKPKHLTPEVVNMITVMLAAKWSPEQISGRLKLDGVLISHERIYQHIWAEKKLGGELYKNLRHAGKKYNRRSSGKAGRGCIPNRIDIKDRPVIIESKLRLGDWEGDTIISTKHQGAIVSAVDRKSKFTKLALVENKTAAIVTSAIRKCFKLVPANAKRTITFDNVLIVESSFFYT